MICSGVQSSEKSKKKNLRYWHDSEGRNFEEESRHRPQRRATTVCLEVRFLRCEESRSPPLIDTGREICKSSRSRKDLLQTRSESDFAQETRADMKPEKKHSFAHQNASNDDFAIQPIDRRSFLHYVAGVSAIIESR